MPRPSYPSSPPASAPSPSAPSFPASVLPPPSSRPPQHLELLHVEGRSVVGRWHNVLVLVWRDPATVELLRRTGELEQEIGRRFPDGFFVLAVLPTVNLHVTPDVRLEAERLMSNHSPALKGIAQVIEGSGFVAAAIRSVAVGVSMFSRHKTPMRIFGGVEPASAWIATLLERDKRATAARLLVEAIRNTAA